MADTAKIQTLRDHTTGEAVAPRTAVKALSGDGTVGQLIGYTEDNVVGNIMPDETPTKGSTNPVQSGGVYEANKWHSNPNLLDNWYFIGGGSQQGGGQFPINQCGQIEYSTNNSYTIDRWKISGAAHVSLNEDYITLNNTSNGTIIFQQFIPRELVSGIIDKKVTVSCLTDKNLYTISYVLSLGYSSGNYLIDTGDIIVDGILHLDLYGYLNGNQSLCFRLWNNPQDNFSVNIIAVKFELGDRQTLAHKEGDKWVLNEVPDFSMELAKCQRYQVELNQHNRAYCYAGIGLAIASTGAYIIIPTPVPLRTTPTIKYTGQWALTDIGGDRIDVNNIRIDNSSVSAISVAVEVNNGLTARNAYILYSKADTSARMLIDANL